MSQTDGKDLFGDTNLKQIYQSYIELKQEIHSLAMHQYIMNARMPPIMSTFITPSEYKKSEPQETFLDLIDIFGFGRSTMASRILNYQGPIPIRSDELNFVFQWNSQSESASYSPLINHMHACQLEAVLVSDGYTLPDGLLYREEIWTLKKNTSICSDELRKNDQELKLKYIIQGRTDIVRTRNSKIPLGKSNNRYFIEIKRVEDFVLEDSLREACLQLIGGNVANTFHSPPVLLTNLANSHFVLYISRDGDPREKLQFQLQVIKMPTFGVALAFLEMRTVSMNSVTSHFGCKPTPHLRSPML